MPVSLAHSVIAHVGSPLTIPLRNSDSEQVQVSLRVLIAGAPRAIVRAYSTREPAERLSVWLEGPAVTAVEIKEAWGQSDDQGKQLEIEVDGAVKATTVVQ